MQLKPELTISVVEDYIKKVNELLSKSYKEGQDEKRQLDTTIQNFIRTTFLDGEAKLKDYKRSVHFHIGLAYLGHEEAEKEMQEDYISSLKNMKNHLVAFQEELKLKLATHKESSKLDDIENETQVRDAEARRRASVVEGKLWGAVIELIDMQRNELKKKDELNKEIIDIKKELKDLKSILLKFAETKLPERKWH